MSTDTFTKIDQGNAAAIVDAVTELAASYGLLVDRIKTGYCPEAGTIDLSMTLKTATSDQDEFERLAGIYGFEPSDFGREFELSGILWKIAGLNPRAKRMMVNLVRVADGRTVPLSDRPGAAGVHSFHRGGDYFRFGY
jgi:hypothetical protein